MLWEFGILGLLVKFLGFGVGLQTSGLQDTACGLAVEGLERPEGLEAQGANDGTRAWA